MTLFNRVKTYKRIPLIEDQGVIVLDIKRPLRATQTCLIGIFRIPHVLRRSFSKVEDDIHRCSNQRLDRRYQHVSIGPLLGLE